MPASKKRVYARYTVAAAKLLGSPFALERKSNCMAACNFADRLGIDHGTLKRLEEGDPKVELGLAFKACALFRIQLCDDDLPGLNARVQEVGQRVALLPRRSHPTRIEANNDF